MVYADQQLEAVTTVVKSCLTKLYDHDSFLFERNNRKGVCERSLVFRFAHYLQNDLQDYYVDCDFNSSWVVERANSGELIQRERSGKEIQNSDGTTTRRFVDIIVHKRDYETENDYICFEFKKWNNREGIEKDVNNLKQLTSTYHYHFGFLITFGRDQNGASWIIFKEGRELVREQLVFGNQL